MFRIKAILFILSFCYIGFYACNKGANLKNENVSKGLVADNYPCDYGDDSECEISYIDKDLDPPVSCMGQACNCAICPAAGEPPQPDLRPPALVDKLSSLISNDEEYQFFENEDDWQTMFPRFIDNDSTEEWSIIDKLRTGTYTMEQIIREPVYYYFILAHDTLSVENTLIAIDIEKE